MKRFTCAMMIVAVAVLVAASQTQASIIDIGATDGKRVVADGSAPNTDVFDAGAYSDDTKRVVTIGSFLVPTATTTTAADFSIGFQSWSTTSPYGMTGTVSLVGVRSGSAATILASDYAATTGLTAAIIETGFVTTSTTEGTTVSTVGNATAEANLLSFYQLGDARPIRVPGPAMGRRHGTVRYNSLYRFDTNGGSLSSANLELTTTSAPEPGTLVLAGNGPAWFAGLRLAEAEVKHVD